MLIYLKRVILFLILINGLSCSSTSQYVAFKEKDDTIQEGNATICVVRPNVIWAAAIKSKIYQDDKLVGRLGHGSYLCWETEAKPLSIVATTENKDVLNLDLVPQQKYFIRLDYNLGFVVGRARLVQIDEQEFDKYLPRLHLPKIQAPK
ncbi:hypothetical protein SAMN05421544_11550 [Riemerella columbipharyngis]|uniref:DUF2846 domain-containing protein n=1 Tax=Riemerella columbipharyngis TaxID=1071918 RepID=A0A1G7EEW3_9FLAO|nr:hypothetical protein SAMN05421544_11550 [Riemerella columbipharyngis]